MKDDENIRAQRPTQTPQPQPQDDPLVAARQYLHDALGAKPPPAPPEQEPVEKQPPPEEDYDALLTPPPNTWLNLDLEQKLRDRKRLEERRLLIDQLKGKPPPPPKPHPSTLVSERAARVRKRRQALTARGVSRGDQIHAQIAELSSLFSDLLTHNAAGESFDEKTGLLIALRAGKLSLEMRLGLARLQEIDFKRGWEIVS